MRSMGQLVSEALRSLPVVRSLLAQVMPPVLVPARALYSQPVFSASESAPPGPEVVISALP